MMIDSAGPAARSSGGMLVRWIAGASGVVALLSMGACSVHWVGAMNRFGVVGATGHAVEYALLPWTVALVRLGRFLHFREGPLYICRPECPHNGDALR